MRQQSQHSADDGSTMMVPRQPLQLPPIEKLKGPENWSVWRTLLALIKRAPNPVEILDEESELYDLDNRARARIVFSLEPHVIQYITGSTTAHGHWTQLCTPSKDGGLFSGTLQSPGSGECARGEELHPR